MRTITLAFLLLILGRLPIAGQPFINDMTRDWLNGPNFFVRVNDESCVFTSNQNAWCGQTTTNRYYWFYNGTYISAWTGQSITPDPNGYSFYATYTAYVYPDANFPPSDPYSYGTVYSDGSQDKWNRAPQVYSLDDQVDSGQDGNINRCMGVVVHTTGPTASWSYQWRGSGTGSLQITDQSCLHLGTANAHCYDFFVSISNPSGKSNSGTWWCKSSTNCSSQICPGTTYIPSPQNQ